jgi:hypothetical protein
MADRLTEGDDALAHAQLAHELGQSGIDSEALRSKLYAAAKRLAEKERAAGRPAPIALQQAIEQLSPDNVMPANETAAQSKMRRWFDKFSAAFTLPERLEAVRAYRKSGDVTPEESADLDALEQDLKEKLKKEHGGEI